MKKYHRIILLITAASIIACAASPGFHLLSAAVKGKPETGFFSGLKSAGRIDASYAAKDNAPQNPRSFPFEWKELPKGTKVLALVFDDPDAKPVMQAYGIKGDSFLHWTAADIDPSAGGLAENASLENHSLIQGKNSGGSTGYVGPMPPSDFPEKVKRPIIHIYRLTVYALSGSTGLKNGFTLADLETAMKGKILGKAELFFSYSN